MYEMPPILRGTEQQQIAALRDYLVRIARNNSSEVTQEIVPASTSSISSSASSSNNDSQKSEVEKLKDKSDQLRQLIIKTANEVYSVSDSVKELPDSLKETYLALSDFGTYKEAATNEIQRTAKNIIESYELSEEVRLVDAVKALNGVSEQIEDLALYQTQMSGQIQRGWIYDPIKDETAFGIAVSSSLSFTGVEHDEDGITYYELEPSQSVGLYTSSGWQFWIDGSKRGWFDSSDGMLHVINIVSENSFKLGSDWEITKNSGFGIKYIGG